MTSSVPVVVLVSGTRTDFLLDEFSRYVRDYELVVATSAAQAVEVSTGLAAQGRQVALFVVDAELPDAPALEAVAC